jgi:hypothetical protein
MLLFDNARARSNNLRTCVFCCSEFKEKRKESETQTVPIDEKIPKATLLI